MTRKLQGESVVVLPVFGFSFRFSAPGSERLALPMYGRETSLSITSRVLVPIMFSWQSVLVVEGVAFRPRSVIVWGGVVA